MPKKTNGKQRAAINREAAKRKEAPVVPRLPVDPSLTVDPTFVDSDPESEAGQPEISVPGSNRSWEWLGMISVSIFALREVIRRVQLDYKIPHNGETHTNPSKTEDVRAVRDYLELHKLQSFCPEHEDNDLVLPVRDLMEVGAAYANTARAFKTFRPDTRRAVNLGTANGLSNPVEDEEDDEIANHDNYGQDLDLDLGDLALDEEEFAAGIEVSDFVAMATEAIMQLPDVHPEFLFLTLFRDP
ncbi:hypothetical protein B0H10DRAFT_2235434 [Mycena sp. CBHHK59/15]|nr:hypothetical protein B0H10DRAFT_2235434 [Mycena sp. CBHHK59/15]